MEMRLRNRRLPQFINEEPFSDPFAQFIRLQGIYGSSFWTMDMEMLRGISPGQCEPDDTSLRRLAQFPACL